MSQLKLPKQKKVRLGKSGIQGWGLYASEDIAKDEFVIEYGGEPIANIAVGQRDKKYKAIGMTDSYFFRVNEMSVIDGTKCGNLARFINHSCEPNCYTDSDDVNILFYAMKPIRRDEELVQGRSAETQSVCIG